MKSILWMGFSIAVAFVSPTPASGQEFSADMVSRSADGKVSRSKLYQTPDKERFDSTVELKAGKTIETHMIIDRREKLDLCGRTAAEDDSRQPCPSSGKQYIGEWFLKL